MYVWRVYVRRAYIHVEGVCRLNHRLYHSLNPWALMTLGNNKTAKQAPNTEQALNIKI